MARTLARANQELGVGQKQVKFERNRQETLQRGIAKSSRANYERSNKMLAGLELNDSELHKMNKAIIDVMTYKGAGGRRLEKGEKQAESITRDGTIDFKNAMMARSSPRRRFPYSVILLFVFSVISASKSTKTQLDTGGGDSSGYVLLDGGFRIVHGARRGLDRPLLVGLGQSHNASFFPSHRSIYTLLVVLVPYVADPPSAPFYTVPFKAARDGSPYTSSTTVDTTPLPALRVLPNSSKRGVKGPASTGATNAEGGAARAEMESGTGLTFLILNTHEIPGDRIDERYVHRHSLAARTPIYKDVEVSRRVSPTDVGEDVGSTGGGGAEDAGAGDGDDTRVWRKDEGLKEEVSARYRKTSLPPLLARLPPSRLPRLHMLRRHTRLSVPPSSMHSRLPFLACMHAPPRCFGMPRLRFDYGRGEGNGD
ncbi:hypothetical protein R3P38DRAFT_2805601 [Favolaschia claudopus]|uniref:Uncharacterized protein n=1 Tax=Favolaschia claudopus TaxID=2862362 RepID=A0AAV9ZNC5_9AGAR